MPSRPLLDALLALHDAELESALPTLSPLPEPLQRYSDHFQSLLRALHTAHLARLADLRTTLDAAGEPYPAFLPRNDDPFAALLSARFLLLKLAESLQLLRTRYANAAARHPDPRLTALAAAISDDFARLSRELSAIGLEPPPEP